MALSSQWPQPESTRPGGLFFKAPAAKPAVDIYVEERQALFAALFGQSAEAVAIADGQQRLLYVNPAFAHLWCIPEGIVNMASMELVLSLVAESLEVREGFQRDVESLRERPAAPLEGCVSTRDGKSLEYSSRPTGDALRGGRIWTFRDSSELRKHLRQLRDANENFQLRLEEQRQQLSQILNELLQEFEERTQMERHAREREEQLHRVERLESLGMLAGGIAHDSNNLLQVILNAVHLLRREIDDPYLLDELKQIQEAATRGREMNRQLLAFGRRQVLRPERLDLNRVLDQHVQMLRRLAPPDVRLDCELAEQALWVRFDPGQLSQVVVNLVVNALEALSGAGWVQLTVSVESFEWKAGEEDETIRSCYALLRVRDSGRGMAPEQVARIFEPFFTTKEGMRGTGLGLATVYGILKQSGGHIEVASELGQGTVFRLYFPLDEE